MTGAPGTSPVTPRDRRDDGCAVTQELTREGAGHQSR